MNQQPSSWSANFLKKGVPSCVYSVYGFHGGDWRPRLAQWLVHWSWATLTPVSRLVLGWVDRQGRSPGHCKVVNPSLFVSVDLKLGTIVFIVLTNVKSTQIFKQTNHSVTGYLRKCWHCLLIYSIIFVFFGLCFWADQINVCAKEIRSNFFGNFI